MWKIDNNVRFYDSYVLGAKYPSLILSITGGDLAITERQALLKDLKISDQALVNPALGDLTWPNSLHWLLQIWQCVQMLNGLPVFECGRVLNDKQQRAKCQVFVVPNSQVAVAHMIAAVIHWLQVHRDVTVDEAKCLSASKQLEKVVKDLVKQAPKGSNVPRFIKAAFELNIPTLWLPGNVVQFGQGSRARRLDSSFTDQTPLVSAKWARNKSWANTILAKSGLPVAAHQIVSSSDEAISVANRLGYPVVVKPADLDGGVGVAAGLDSEEEVKLAYEDARKCSKNILVEKHIVGKDYRLTVLHGEVIWAIEREPAGVKGNGLSSVNDLVDLINAEPMRGEGPHAPLKKIVLNEEAYALLKKQGLEVDSVPPVGAFVRLRRTANIATGGRPIAVHEYVHPDNARLAVRAAQALNLDFAGIDLLIDDVAHSWQVSSNVAICEVNGQPNIGQSTAAHLYGEILRRLLNGNARLPIILVLGASNPAPWLLAFEKALTLKELRVGVAGPEGVTINGEQILTQTTTIMSAGEMFALNPNVDAMVIALTDDAVLRKGLPWARYDALVIAGDSLPACAILPETSDSSQMMQLWLRRLLPACDGFVIANPNVLQPANLAGISSAKWASFKGDPYAFAERTLEKIL
jgi:cyanophycin synthetase